MNAPHAQEIQEITARARLAITLAVTILIVPLLATIVDREDALDDLFQLVAILGFVISFGVASGFYFLCEYTDDYGPKKRLGKILSWAVLIEMITAVLLVTLTISAQLLTAAT